MLASDDPYLLHGAIDLLAHAEDTAALQAHAADADPKIRLGVLLAWRRSERPEGREGLTRWLSDADGAVRRAALQWIAEERLAEWKDKAAAALQGQPSSLTFQSYLAALQLIESGKPDPKVSAAQTVQVALDPARPPELRALALRLAPVEHPDLPIPKLEALAGEQDAGDSPGGGPHPRRAHHLGSAAGPAPPRRRTPAAIRSARRGARRARRLRRHAGKSRRPPPGARRAPIRSSAARRSARSGRSSMPRTRRKSAPGSARSMLASPPTPSFSSKSRDSRSPAASPKRPRGRPPAPP